MEFAFRPLSISLFPHFRPVVLPNARFILPPWWYWQWLEGNTERIETTAVQTRGSRRWRSWWITRYSRNHPINMPSVENRQTTAWPYSNVCEENPTKLFDGTRRRRQWQISTSRRCRWSPFTAAFFPQNLCHLLHCTKIGIGLWMNILHILP